MSIANLALSPTVATDNFAFYHGDSVEVIKGLPDDSIHLTVSSPPFPSMYVYNNTPRDIGNTSGIGEMLGHFGFLVKEMLRVTVPGRTCCIHLTQVPALKMNDGYVGRFDFRGDVIRLFQAKGWIYASEVLIDKALADGTPVLTPNGWQPIESLDVGSLVIGSDGKATRVEAVHTLGVRPLFEVEFADGEKVTCDGGHLWTVETLAGRQNKTGTVDMTTEELLERGLYTPNGLTRYSVPIVAPVEYESEAMAIDPYLLGVLIANGSLTGRGVSFCGAHETAARVNVPEHHRVKEYAGTSKASGTMATYSVASDGIRRNEVMDELRRLGVFGKRAWEKSLPESALRASVSDRRELLRGLLDCDGTISIRGKISYSSTSYQLALNVADLSRSLGGIAVIHAEDGSKYRYKDEIRQGRDIWRVAISMPPGWCPFALARKAERWRDRTRTLRRAIVSIKPVDSGNATCITVAASDGLFVIDGFVVTHNCPQVKAQRTKDRGLLFKSLAGDSSVMAPAMADYILVFRKPGENPLPIKAGRSEKYGNPDGWITQDEWIEWAAAVWYRRVRGGADGLDPCEVCDDEEARKADDELRDALVDIAEEGINRKAARYAMENHPSQLQVTPGIKESNVLNVRVARDEKDERHLCPLQLDVIERCIKLWSNPGEIVFDPFGGIGSTPYQAIKLRRKGTAVELKESYFKQGVRNCQSAERSRVGQATIFDAIGEREREGVAG